MKNKTASGLSIFEIWMLQESDTIQALAKSHGERIALEQLIIAVGNLKGGLK